MTKKLTCSCGNSWNYTGQNKKRATCPDCRKTVKIALLPIVAIFILAIGFSYAYAYEETVTLPSGDYLGYHCYAVVWNPLDWEFTCTWGYGDTLQSVEYPRNGTVIVPDNRLDDPWTDLLDKVKAAIDKIKTPEDGLNIDASVDAKVTKGITDIDEEILDEFEKCFGGLEQAHAVQQEYSFEKFERKYQRFLTGDDKLAEECIANGVLRNYTNAAYPLKVVREDTTPKTKIPELKMSKGTQVTDEKKQAIADAVEYPPWYKNPYTDWDGVNRGTSEPIISENVVNQFTGKTSKQIMDEYKRERAANIMTEQDLANLNAELEKLVCETAWKTSGYGGLDIGKWRTFLADGWCNDKLGEVTFRGQMMAFEDVIESKLAQKQDETRPDLRSQK